MAKAEQFLLLASAAEEQEWDAAISNAAIAAINASDVLISLERGSVGHAAEHENAVKVLRDIGFSNESNHLARLLKIKNIAQYGERRCTAAEAASAFSRAQRLTNSARSRLEKEKK